MYYNYAIMQEPGRQAKRRSEQLRREYGTMLLSPRPKRLGTVSATGQVEALGDYIHDKYLATGNQQYAGHRLEWTGARSNNSKWHPWHNGDDPIERGRYYRAVVTLRNGINEHDTILYAWKV